LDYTGYVVAWPVDGIQDRESSAGGADACSAAVVDFDISWETVVNDDKGWQTSEFWMNLAAVVVAYLMSTDIGEPNSLLSRALIAVAAALAALGYTGSRAVVKRERLRMNGGVRNT
jgi:hypothetical protein